MTEKASTAHIGGKRFVGEPVIFVPNHALADIGRQFFPKHLLGDFHLSLVLGAEENLEIGLADDPLDGGAQRRVVLFLESLVAGVFRGVECGVP